MTGAVYREVSPGVSVTKHLNKSLCVWGGGAWHCPCPPPEFTFAPIPGFWGAQNGVMTSSLCRGTGTGTSLKPSPSSSSLSGDWNPLSSGVECTKYAGGSCVCSDWLSSSGTVRMGVILSAGISQGRV
ncbi:hypothetical protein FKM82_029652 [Ascaphus truei]